jgi:hypothetical protein
LVLVVLAVELDEQPELRPREVDARDEQAIRVDDAKLANRG